MKYKLYDEKICSGYLFIPLTINGETRQFEFARWVERLCPMRNGWDEATEPEWIPKYFLDD